ncbi:hypothetical protein COCMIDRAFT_39979 [Bipolaris oryzae ATCC 44560]|uniref:Uncharacterized protein n=1 Tax=Bipolaris oryzae ATCC 44560 TaxID=930090 RepID=W6ZEE2_COCMI|nr:uncharacterized protein COCMIDRAFT_39979 [Bipolaris oryzae ATCC 44560]EUC41896.1 hypothetical protein COCMIDRAFT_39979 [Bipolaris oryzae ATCC 44560]
MLADSIQRFCTNKTCGVCKNHAECFCSDIQPYPEIVSNQRLWSAGLQYAHYIQLLRHSIVIKMPLVRYNSLCREERNSRNVPFPAQTVIAILPLSPRSHEYALFEILLQQISAVSYVRLSGKPHLLQDDMIGASPAELGAYTVHDTHPSSGPDPIGKIIPGWVDQNWLRKCIKIKSRSATLLTEKCHCENGGFPTTTCIGIEAQFPLPSHHQDHFSVTVSFRDVSGTMLSGTIILGDSVTQMELREIRLSDGPNVDHPYFLKRDNQTQRCMRVSAPIPNTGDFIDVTLRKFPVIEVEFSMGENFKKSSRNNAATSIWGGELGILKHQYRLDIHRSSEEIDNRPSTSNNLSAPDSSRSTSISTNFREFIYSSVSLG